MLNFLNLKNEILNPKKIILVLIFFIILSSILAATFQQINEKFIYGPYGHTHDGAVEVEESVKFLLKGKNPYTENYFNTPMENMGGLPQMDFVNPALYHLVYLPFNTFFSIPFFIISDLLIHQFDVRIVYIFIFLLFIATILKWPDKSLRRKLVFLSIFAINPLFMMFFIEGRNDIFVFAWTVLAIYFLEQKKYFYSSLALAFAATSKHSSWFILPFYFSYLYYLEANKAAIWQKIKNIYKKTYLFFAASAIIIIPFLIWDYASFADDIFKYANGTAYMSYPITGFGFSQLILQLGLVKSPNDYWPFWIPQVIFSLPLLYILLKMQKNNNTLAQMVFNYSLLLMTFWLFSRFFNDNYIGFLTMLLFFAIFLGKKPNKISLPFKIPL